MIFTKNILIFLKNFLKSKWIIELPKKNKFLLLDGLFNPFLEYIDEKDITVLHRRYEQINLLILFRCILKFKLTTLDYCVEFIKHVSPNLILTGFDYHTIAYKLSKKTGIKTLVLQKGARTKSEGIIKNSNFFFPKKSKKNFFVDYFLVYSNEVKKFYSKRVNGNYFIIGSFENNFTKPVLKKQKKEIVFISNFSGNAESFKSENENIIALELYKLAKKKKLKFRILPKFIKNSDILKKEKSFYENIFPKKPKFILNKKKTSYQILLNYKYIFASYSTLAQECLVKGIKVGFILFKSLKSPAYGYRFGYYEKLKKNGLFWTAFGKLDKSEIERVFNFVINTKYSIWIKKTTQFSNKVMSFDYKNTVFNKIIKKFMN